jgi:CheY-like chemotaxis protein
MRPSRNTHILLIEDNPADINLIKAELVKHSPNCTFTVATDGEQAMNILKSTTEDSSPDLVILDLNLPKVDGHKVLALLKSNPLFKQTPVVVFSSSSSIEDIRRVYESYGNCYIVKPFDLDAFQAAIQKIWEFWFEVSKLPEHSA